MFIDNEYDRFAGHQVADYIYWIFSAILFASALHCILTTVYCTVYGAGLALRGPLGSMVKAVDGMVAEQHAILCSFIICLFSFAMVRTYGQLSLVKLPYINQLNPFSLYSHVQAIFGW